MKARRVWQAGLVALASFVLVATVALAGTCPIGEYRVNSGTWTQVTDTPGNLCDWFLGSGVGVSNTLEVKLFNGSFAFTGDAFQAGGNWYGIPNHADDRTIWAGTPGLYVIRGWSYGGCLGAREDAQALLAQVNPAGRTTHQLTPDSMVVLPSCWHTPTPTSTVTPKPTKTPSPSSTPTATPRRIHLTYLPVIMRSYVSRGNAPALVVVDGRPTWLKLGEERVLSLNPGSKVLVDQGSAAVFASDGKFVVGGINVPTSIVFSDSAGTYRFTSSGGGLFMGPALDRENGRADGAIWNRREATGWDQRPLYWLNPAGGPPVLVP